MKHHTVATYLGSLEEKVILDLAKNPDTLILPIHDRIQKDEKNVYNAVMSLKRKGCVKEGPKIPSNRGILTQSYRLTSDGLLQVFLRDAVDIDRIGENYRGESFITEYKRLISRINNKSLVRKLIRKAAQLALAQDSRDAVNMNPDALVGMSIDSVRFYSALPEKDRDSLKELKNKVVHVIDGRLELTEPFKAIHKAIKERSS